MTRLARFSNNASSRLAANLTAVGLTCTITPGEGAKFPTLTGSQFFMATLVKADGTKEVIKVTARATDTFTIQRAAEAVADIQTAYSFSAGDRIELRMTAGVLGNEFDRLDLSTIARVSNKSANYTVLVGDLSTLFRVDTSGGTRTITLPAISATGDEFKLLVSKTTADANLVSIAAAGADTINGLSSYSLTQQWAGAWLIADKSTNTWTAINSGSSAGNWVIDAYTGTGVAGPFTLSGNPGSKNNTSVFVGGVYQQKSTYTLVGLDITLGGVVGVGVPVEIIWSAPVAFGVPSDLSVTTGKIATGAVTEPKLGDDVRRAIRDQQYSAFTTAGTSTAYTLTPVPSVAAYAAHVSFWVNFHAASGASPTLQISGLASPPNLVRQTSAGTYANIAAGEIPINHRSRVTLISTTQALVEDLPLPAATTTTPGIVELETTAETAAGTDTTRATTAAGVEAHMLANALGWGQTWQSITGSRALNTTYTNSTGRPIFVAVAVTGSIGSSANLLASVGGVTVIDTVIGINSGTPDTGEFYFPVPDGLTYKIDLLSGGGTLRSWGELR